MSEAVTLVCTGCGKRNRVPAARLDEGPKCGACGRPLAGGDVADVSPAVHDRMIAADGLPLVVDYWAPWCGPCRMMAPEFARAAQALKGRVRFAKVDTEAHPEVGGRLGIRGIPLLILWSGGLEGGRLAGARPAAEIAAFAARDTHRDT